MASIHVNDIGTVFQLVVSDQDNNIVNLHGATLLEIIFMRPDQSTFIVPAVLTTDGTDGKMQYTTIAGDLNMSGTWQYQGYFAVNGIQDHTDSVKFKVLANLA